VQVKSATATAQLTSYFALFNVPRAQLSVPRDTPALVYVFVTRFQNRWSDFIVIRRSTLFARVNEGAGKLRVTPDRKEYVQLRIVFSDAAAQCGPVDFQRCRNAWEPWPPLQFEEEDAPPRAHGNIGDAVPPGDNPPSEKPGERPQPFDRPTPPTAPST
jgi:hypothetical protein